MDSHRCALPRVLTDSVDNRLPSSLLFAVLVVALPAAAHGEGSPETVPFAIAGTEGFGIVSADGASRLITHWLLQSDLRAFLSSHSPTPDRETFLLRFGGMRLDATLERSFRAALFVNLAQNQVFLLEGWIEASLAPGVQLRAGKILYPISEERLTPGINLPFVSTSVAAMLLPARDTGVELFGSLAGDRIFWNLALTSGSVPGGAGDAVADSGKDLVGRLYVHPFLAAGVEPLRKLGLGLGASTGGHNGTSDNSRLFSLQSYGGQTFFLFATGAVASGRAQRVVPHLTWGFGPVSAYADAVWARDKISGTDVTSNAWCWTTSFVLTGEDAAPLTFVIPSHPLDLPTGHFGAFEIVDAVGKVMIGSAAFPALASPAVAMKGMTAYGLGLNWYPSRGVALLVTYGNQVFTAADSAPARPNEDTLTARFQLIL